MNLICYSDGAARGNPGPAGAGAVIKHEGRVLQKLQRYLGECTNNVAEYSALLMALEAAVGLGAEQVECRLDSELVVLQMQGRYRVRDARLRLLYQRARALVEQISQVSFTHVRREHNRLADALANAAIDQRRAG